jgi:hypothetical protein
MSAFQREILVRFGHCDAAGWVFYPRYFEMISDFVEDWFEDGLAASAPGLFHHKQILTPSVHFTVDFVKPTRYGDRLTFNLWTVKIGKTSCELRDGNDLPRWPHHALPLGHRPARPESSPSKHQSCARIPAKAPRVGCKNPTGFWKCRSKRLSTRPNTVRCLSMAKLAARFTTV